MMCFPVLVTSEDEGNLETLSVIVLLLPNKKCLSSLTSLPPPSRILNEQPLRNVNTLNSATPALSRVTPNNVSGLPRYIVRGYPIQCPEMQKVNTFT